jgi:hypothetical protein
MGSEDTMEEGASHAQIALHMIRHTREPTNSLEWGDSAAERLVISRMRRGVGHVGELYTDADGGIGYVVGVA